MSNVNVQVSITNVPQFDRHQNDLHRSPMVNQEQNADIANDAAHQRVRMPVEPDQTEGKTVDTKQKREEDLTKRKRKKKGPKPPQNSENVNVSIDKKRERDSGRFLDVEA